MPDAPRLVLLGLPLSALAVFVTTAPRGDFLTPDDAGFAAWAASDGFAAWASASLNGTVWAIFGFLALYGLTRGRVDPRHAQWATVAVVAGLAVFLPVTGIVAIAWPVAAEQALAGDAGAIAWLQAIGEHRTFRVWAIFATVAWGLGVVGWAWCLRRTPVAAGALALGGLGLAYPSVLAIEWTAAGLYLLATALITWRVWVGPPQARQRPSPP